MATINEIKSQGNGRYSVRIGNQKFNDLSLKEAQSRSASNFQVAPDSETDSPNQKRINASRGIRVGDSDAMRDSALRNNPLDATAVGNVNPINIPNRPVLDGQKGLIAGGNASLVNPQMGVSTDAQGNLVVDSSKDPFQSLLETYLGNQPKMPSAEETYNRLPEKKALERASEDVNRYASQINNIQAQAQAESLALEGQGRGITESIIGGQQAQISREAAIKALPLQALLANAQGNKELAQQQLDTVFKLRMEDAQAQYEYKSKILGLVYDFATAAEKRRLDEVQRKEDREFQRETLKIQQDHDLRMEQIGFANQRALKLMDAGPSVPTIKTINGVDMQYNSDTGEWETPNVSGGTGNEQVQKTIDQLAFLREEAKKAKSLSGASGPSGISKFLGDKFVGDTKFRQLEQKANTLRVNVLALSTDPTIKKFFGPQMSNADVNLMTSAGTTLNPESNSPEQMKDEIERLENLFERMETSLLRNTYEY